MHTNGIYCGDCQGVLGNTNAFPDESVDMIYGNSQYQGSERANRPILVEQGRLRGSSSSE